MMRKRDILKIGLVLLIVLLVLFRILLPGFVTKYLNRQLHDLDPYVGRILDVDLYLYRGAYVIKGLQIEKKGTHGNEPFVSIPSTELSVQWKSLFRGAIVGEILVQSPTFHFVMAEKSSEEQLGTEADWTEVVEGLMPIQINRLVLNSSTVFFIFKQDTFSNESSIEMEMVEVSNIRNITDPEEIFPSEIVARGSSSTYGSSIHFDAAANFIKAIPDIDYNLEIENVDLKTTNPWFLYFTKMDFEKGSLDLFSEMVIEDGKIEGYFKPVFEDARIFNLREKDRTLFQGIKELFTEGIQEVLENRAINTTASKIPIQGNLDAPSTNFWVSLVGFIRNAYWNAIKRSIDDSITPDQE